VNPADRSPRATASERCSGERWGAGLEGWTGIGGADRLRLGHEGDSRGRCGHGESRSRSALCAGQQVQDGADRAIIVVVGRGRMRRLAAVRDVRIQGCDFSGVMEGVLVDVAEGQDKLKGDSDQRHPAAKPATPPKPAHWPKTHAPTAFPGVCNIITLAAVKACALSLH